MKRSILAIGVAVVAGAAALLAHTMGFAASATPGDPPTLPPSASLTFSFALWDAVQQESQAINRVISPISAQMALSMLYNGAAGTTQSAMAETLGIPGIPLATVNQQAQATLVRLHQENDASLEVQVANSLWLNQGIPIEPGFIDSSQRFYQAEVQTLPFDPAALTRINAWASQKTQGKIPAILDDIDPRGVAYLLNAVYFQGDWTRAFDPNLTRPAPFTLGSGETIEHPLMNLSGTMPYLETDTFQAVQLPYGKSGSLRMTVILPKGEGSLGAVYEQLSPATWMTWGKQFQASSGSLSLPRFQTEATFDLQPLLTRMGMGIAFTSAADFRGLTAEPATISQAIQKTFIDVNERGTEAAAVTAIGITRTSIEQPQDRFSMVVNRPFFLVIGSDAEILFMGDIGDPRSE